MNKHYKKFYEVGQNRYYTLEADNDLFLATETFIPTPNRFKFLKPIKMIQGLKLLKMSPPVMLLLSILSELEPIEQAEDIPQEFSKYPVVDPTEVKTQLYSLYKQAMSEQKREVVRHFNNVKKNLDKADEKYVDWCIQVNNQQARALADIEAQSPLHNHISLKRPVGNKTINDFIHNLSYNFLYSEKVTAIAENVFLYRQDSFGTITFFKLFIVKNVIKSMDTYVYDINLLKALFNSMQKKEGK